jgi:hypothetical protein
MSEMSLALKAASPNFENALAVSGSFIADFTAFTNGCAAFSNFGTIVAIAAGLLALRNLRAFSRVAAEGEPIAEKITA